MEPTDASGAVGGDDGSGGIDAAHANGANGAARADAPVVADNAAKSRYELHVGGELAGFISYRRGGEVIDLLHTEVDPKFQGSGLAGRLAQETLDDARARHLAVLPTCPFIRSWIRRHPDYADLVPPERRSRLGL
jgi:predicted GNAT family acetyltransferase